MRVLISAESFVPAVNGVTNSVLRVADHLARHGHDVRVIAPGPGPSELELESGATVRIERVRGFRLPRYRSLSFGLPASRRIRAVMDDFQPDIVHLAAPVILGRSIGTTASKLGLRTVALFQTDLSGFITNYGLSVAAGPVWDWLRRIHNKADLTLAPTPTIAADLRKRHFQRVEVWGRGVDHLQFSPDRRSEEFRTACGLEPGQVLVGYVGRLAAEKRVDRLRALTANPGIKLVVVGEGPERQRLEALLPGAHFTGFRSGDELGEAMASLDLFVHTGEHETFGQTIQEAMSCGVPVIAPSAGGPLDLVQHGVNGLLYPPDSAATLARHVQRLALNEAARTRFGEAARSTVADRSWEMVGRELISHYEGLLTSAQRAA